MKTLFILNDTPYGNERSLKSVPVRVCGSCMDARGISDAELVDGTKRSNLEELADWTQWAEKIAIF